MRDYRLNEMFHQLAAKLEELRGGTAPEEVKGSTTIRAAIRLIAGVNLDNTILTDEFDWSMLDEVQKRTVVHFRPTSKYAAWLERDLEEKRLVKNAETYEQRTFRQYIEWQTETTYCMEFELKARLAEALAVLAKRSSLDAMKAFTDDDEEAFRMAWALQEVGSALDKMGLKP